MKLSFWKTYCTPYEIVSCYDNLKDEFWLFRLFPNKIYLVAFYKGAIHKVQMPMRREGWLNLKGTSTASHHSFVTMCTRRKGGVKYLAYLSINSL